MAANIQIDAIKNKMKLIAVTRKGSRTYVREIDWNDRKKVRQKCIESGWSSPTFYDPNFTTYRP